MASQAPIMPVDIGSFITSEFLEWRKQAHKNLVQVRAEVKGLRKQVRKATKSIEFSNKDGNIHQANQKKQDRDATPRLLNNRQWKLGDQERTFKSMEKVINAGIAQYARTSCLALTSCMYHKLPRELRDMIYIDILFNDDHEMTGWSYDDECLITSSEEPRSKAKKPVTSVEYMGVLVYKELLKSVQIAANLSLQEFYRRRGEACLKEMEDNEAHHHEREAKYEAIRNGLVSS